MVSANSNVSTSRSPKHGLTTGITQTTEKSSGGGKVPQAAEDNFQGAEPQDIDIEYVTGYKLAIVVVCVALSCFLMLLDAMIISTVNWVPARTMQSGQCTRLYRPESMWEV
jgi:hypothetical protein